MHEEPKILLKASIKSCLPVLQPLVGQFSRQYRVWKKKKTGHWQGVTEVRPDVHRAFRAAKDQIKEAEKSFVDAFVHRHPEYSGLVGFRGSTQNWSKNHGNIVRSALGTIWHRRNSFDVDDTMVDTIVQEVADFIQSSTVHLRFHAQLINFRMDCESIELPSGLKIRRLSEEEVSQHHGGPIGMLGLMRPQFDGPYEFVMEGQLEEPKILGGNHTAGETMSQRARSVLDNAILCLRTFKEGLVGYDYIHFNATNFCPLSLGSIGGGVYIPLGSYTLGAADFNPLSEHAKLIFSSSEKAMQMACFRLAEAENQSRPEDKIVDAVIGMESLLLAGLGREDRRGELSFRFSLNFSMIFNNPEERQRAYKIARDLYCLRSVIAHGSQLDKDKVKIGGEMSTLEAAGRTATATLRYIIMYFLSKNDAPYKNSDFWQRRYFGFPSG